MTSVDRARDFLKTRATKLALTIVPLAVAVVPAHAATLSIANPSCSIGTTSANKTGSCTAQTVGNNSNTTLNALDVFGNTTFTSTNSSGGNAFSATFTASGPASGQFSGNVPVSYVFSISESNPSDPITWSLKFDLFPALATQPAVGGTATSYSVTIPGTGTGQFSGPSTITGPLTPTSISSWDVILTVSTSGNFGDSVTVNIPSGSTLNLNTAAAGTPEPTSIIGMGSGLAALFAFFRRRKKQA